MIEMIHEPIDILVSFQRGRVIPILFMWRGKKYAIQKLNLIHKKKNGNDTIYYFSVTDAANAFKLSFSVPSLHWRIEEWYSDG